MSKLGPSRVLANQLILGQKVKGLGHRVTKYTCRVEGDRVAGVSLHSIEYPTSSLRTIYALAVYEDLTMTIG